MSNPQRAKLTKGYLDRIRPGARDEFHWDTDTKGFGVRVTPGGKLTFIVQGRVDGAETAIRITVGPYGVFTVDQARDEAREHLRAMRKGIDPRAARKADEAAKVTLQQVCDAYASRPGKLKPSSTKAIKRHVTTTFEAWKDKPIAAITEDMCKARYREMLTKGLRGKQGAPGQANQGFAILGALLAYAGRQYRRADGSPLCSRAPVDALKDDRVRLKPRTTRILDHKVGAVWLALRDWRGETYNRDTASSIDLVRLLLLTGLRISEASSLKWSQVNLEDGYFHLPNPKNSNPVSMPLSTQAVELLKARPRVEGSDYVFPSWGAAGHIVDPRDVMKKVSGVAGNHLSPHDLRRTFTNIALRSCRIEKFRTDLLTNHITRDVTAEHYFDTTNLQWLAPEAQLIADWLDQQAAIAAGANVERLQPRAQAA
jgi:integrase